MCRCCQDLLQYLRLLARFIYSLCAGKLKMGKKIIPVTVQQQKHLKLEASWWDLEVCNHHVLTSPFLKLHSANWITITRLLHLWMTNRFWQKKSGLAHTIFFSFEQHNLYALSKVVIKNVTKSSFLPTNFPCKIQISRFWAYCPMIFRVLI